MATKQQLEKSKRGLIFIEVLQQDPAILKLIQSLSNTTINSELSLTDVPILEDERNRRMVKLKVITDQQVEPVRDVLPAGASRKRGRPKRPTPRQPAAPGTNDTAVHPDSETNRRHPIVVTHQLPTAETTRSIKAAGQVESRKDQKRLYSEEKMAPQKILTKCANIANI